MTRSLLLLCLLVSSPAFSAKIEIAQWVPWKFVEEKFLPKTMALSFHEDNFELNAGELTPKLQFQADVTGEVTNHNFGEDGFSVSHHLSSTINVSKISIDQFIVRVVAGNVLRIHVKADCSPFHINMNDMRTETFLGYKEEGNIWAPKLQNFSLRIPSWNLGNIQCSGLGGLGDEIKEQIQNALSGPAIFEGLLKEIISAKLAQYFYSSWDTVLSSTGNDLSISGMGKPTAKGLIVYAHLNGSREVSIPEPDEQTLSGTTPQMIFSREGFETILKDKINAMIPQKYNLQEIAAFKKLSSSRFLQYFVWPDLRRFSSGTPFYFSTIPDQSQLELQGSAGNYQTYFNTNAVLQTVMGGSSIDYLQMGLGVQTTLNVQVVNGEILLKTGSAKLSMAWSFGLLYQMLFRPVNRIATDIMISSMNSMFSNQKSSQKLPSITIEGKELKLQNWKQNSDVITMDWL